MPNGIAILDVSSEVIREALKLPLDAEIIASEDAQFAGVVRLLVEHESIPTDAIQVQAIFRSIHGVTVFDRFDTVKRHDKAA